MRRSASAVLLAAALLAPQAAALPASAEPLVDPGTGYTYETDTAVVPMIFPVLGATSYSDNWLACRSGCSRMHMGQDLMGAKMSPMVAAFDGTVTQIKREAPGTNAGNYLVLTADSGPSAGWSAIYVHVNNDTPGTDDGRGTADHAFPKGIQPGVRVLAGQLLGWRGDSGNAEGTAPHIHFELRKTTPDGKSGWGGTVYNAYPSLQKAARITAPRPSGPHPSGTLIRRPDGALFLLDGQAKRAVSPTVLPALGRTAAQAVPVPDAEALYYPTGPAARPRDGSAVRGPDGRLWLVTAGRRTPATAQSLAALGLASPRVWPLAQAEIDALPEGPAPTGPLYPGALVRRGGVVHQVDSAGTLRPATPGATASHGWTSQDVSSARVPDSARTGAALGLRDGTLVVTVPPPVPAVRGGLHRRFLDERRAREAAAAGPSRVGVVSGGLFRVLHDSRQVAAYGYAGLPRQSVPTSDATGLPLAEIATARR